MKFFKKKKLSFALIVLFLHFPNSLIPVAAQTEQPMPTLDSPQLPSSIGDILKFDSPQWEKEGTPGRREDPGRRGGDENLCQRPVESTSENPSGELALTAIAPISVRTLTVQERPTFWFFIPYQSHPNLNAKFILRTWENGKEGKRLYEGTFPLINTAGIVSITLPATAEILEEGKEYRWVFTVVCNPNRPIEEVSVKGVIRRIPANPTLKMQLENATPEQRTVLYAQGGIWQDMITSLAAEIWHTNYQKAGERWIQLLQSVGLFHISSQSIIDCCRPKN